MAHLPRRAWTTPIGSDVTSWQSHLSIQTEHCHDVARVESTQWRLVSVRPLSPPILKLRETMIPCFEVEHVGYNDQHISQYLPMEQKTRLVPICTFTSRSSCVISVGTNTMADVSSNLRCRVSAFVPELLLFPNSRELDKTTRTNHHKKLPCSQTGHARSRIGLGF